LPRELVETQDVVHGYSTASLLCAARGVPARDRDDMRWTLDAGGRYERAVAKSAVSRRFLALTSVHRTDRAHSRTSHLRSNASQILRIAGGVIGGLLGFRS
jgi:hypothetical protein